MPRSARPGQLAGALLLCLASSLVLAAPVSAAPKTRWVDNDGRAGSAGCGATAAAFTSIQKAVTASAAGDTVKVCPGTYVGKVVIQGARDGLSLLAVQKHAAILRAPATQTLSTIFLVTVTGVDNVTVKGFALRARVAQPCDLATGIKVSNAAHVTLRGNDIRPGSTNTLSSCGVYDGINALNGTTGTIAGNAVRDFRNDGIRAVGTSTNVSISNNAVSYLHLDWDPAGGYAILVRDSATGAVAGNTVTVGATKDIAAGIYAYQPDPDTLIEDNSVDRATVGIKTQANNIEIRTNTITRGQIGISVGASNNNDVHGNSATNASINGIYLAANTSGNNVHGNDFRGNTGDDCVDATNPLANTWANNQADDSNPGDLCVEPPG